MPDPSERSPIVWENASAEEAGLVGHVVSVVEQWEKELGHDFTRRCIDFYRQYRGFQDFDKQVRQQQVNGRNDRDGVVIAAKERWGADLHIPLSYRTIESMVPKAIAHMPKILVKGRQEQWWENVETVRLLLDAQQNQINIDLPQQAVMRSGGIYGLGVSKTYWRTEVTTARRAERYYLRPSRFLLGPPKPKVTFDDPTFEDVDLFDFIWDLYGEDMRTCEWVVHRRWMSLETILQRLESGTWDTESAQKLDEDKVRALGTDQGKWSEIWSDRLSIAGFNTRNPRSSGRPHEVLEFHDGENVCTVLDRLVLVQEGENPTGRMPFQIYRPTPVNKELVGIGWLEPLEHLQRELNTIRSQRRDKVTLALKAGYVYDENAIDPEDITFGPEMAIPSSNVAPKDAMWPIPVNDVTGSGWQEEQAIRADIAAVSGESDQLEPASPGQSSTATEAQLVQASLSKRIELTSRRFEIEIVREAARQFLWLDQRQILTERPALYVPQEGMSWEQASQAGDWRKFAINPGALEGDFEIEVEGGSMAARNIPQDRADAAFILDRLAHNWYLDPVKPLLYAMKLLGIEHPHGWLRDPTPNVPLAALRFIIEAGVDESVVIQSVLRAREVSAPEEGPAANQLAEQVPVAAGGGGEQR